MKFFFCIFMSAVNTPNREKLMWRKKIFSFFRSESANFSVIFSQSNANFLPIFHFNTVSYHLINMFNATQLIFDFTLTRNKSNLSSLKIRNGRNLLVFRFFFVILFLWSKMGYLKGGLAAPYICQWVHNLMQIVAAIV